MSSKSALSLTSNQSSNQLPVFEPPCTCTECTMQFRTVKEQHAKFSPYRSQLTDEEAAQIVATNMENMKNDIRYLQSVCASHGDLIMSRWKKKNRDKRKTILLKADPNMYPKKWFVPRYANELLKTGNGDLGVWRKYPKGYLLPYINVEELQNDPSKFLSLLLNRTRFSPEQWAPHDNKIVQSGWSLGGLEVDYNAGAIIMYGERYGELTTWEKDAAERWAIIGFPRANLVISAQASLMALLRFVVQELLQGIDTSIAGRAEKWNQAATQGFKNINSVEFSSAYLNQPFSAPPLLDIDNLISIAGAKLDDLGDHIWLLQTDPGYLRRTIKEICVGYNTPNLQPDAEDYYQSIAIEILAEWEYFIGWKWIHGELQHIKAVMFEFRDSIRPGQPLPPKLDRALGALDVIIQEHLERHLAEISATFSTIPGCSAYQIENGVRVPHPTRATRSCEMLDQDLLRWTLFQLQWIIEDSPRKLDNAILFSMLDEHLSKSGSEERRRISGRLYQRISLAATANELLNALRLNRPLTTKRTIKDCVETETGLVWRYSKIIHDAPVDARWYNIDSHKEMKMRWINTFETFDKHVMPVGKPDKTWIESFDKLWETFGKIWDIFRELQSSNFSYYGLTGEEMEKQYESSLLGSTSPEFVAAFEFERKKLLARISGAPRTKPSSTYVPWISEPTTESATIKTTTQPEKKKTRGQQTTVETEDLPDVESLEIADEDKPVRATVKTLQSYNILMSMLKSSDDKGKMVEWNAFVTAMAEAGFTATSSGGSAVSFEADENSQNDWKGRIVFHKPHPVTKIDPIKLQDMGKRMKKWFGWDEDTFELAGDS